MLFESYRGTSKFLQLSHFSDILMVLKNPGFKSCERIQAIDFSLSLEIISLDILT